MPGLDIAGFVVSLISMIASTLVPISLWIIDWKRALKEKQERISMTALRFLHETRSERTFLPLCEASASIDPIRAKNRNIFNEYASLRKEEQTEALLRLGIKPLNIPNIRPGYSWLDHCLDCLERDIEKYKLGGIHGLLYDNGKYLERATRYGNQKYEVDDRRCFPRIYLSFSTRSFFQSEEERTYLDFDAYLSEYMHFSNGDKGQGLMSQNPNPPIDLAYQQFDLGNCNQLSMVSHCLQIIDSLITIIGQWERDIDHCLPFIVVNDEDMTLEDKFYEVATNLFLLYGADSSQGMD